MNLTEVIQEQRLRHPELSSLSSEHITEILVNHILSMKDKGVPGLEMLVKQVESGGGGVTSQPPQQQNPVQSA